MPDPTTEPMTEVQPARTSIAWRMLSVLATPWLLFISTTSALFLDSQEDLGYTLWFLAPFGLAFAALAAFGFALSLLSSRVPALGLALWGYYLTGPFFLAFNLLREIRRSIRYEVILLSALVAIFFVLLFLTRRLVPGRYARAWAWLAIVLAAADVLSFISRYEFSATEPIRAELSQQARDRSALPNIYHLIFDGYQSDVFPLTLTPEIAEDLRGFHFFPRNITPSGRTRVSIPSVFAGKTWDPESPLESYISGAMDSEQSLLHQLAEAGYQTRGYLHKRFSFEPNLFDEVVYHQSYYRDDIVRERLLRSDAFEVFWVYKYLPRLLSRSILGDELVKRCENKRLAPRAFVTGSYATFSHFLDNEQHLPATGRYTFVHLLLPHEPFVLNGECEYRQGASPMEQFSCASRMIGRLVRRLKRLDRFDDSLILIHGDHGLNLLLDGESLSSVAFDQGGVDWNTPRSKALLLLKPAGRAASAELVVAQAETSLLDIKPTILQSIGVTFGQEIEGVPLTSTFESMVDRTLYYQYHTSAQPDKIYRFKASGGRLAFDRTLSPGRKSGAADE